MPGVEQKTINVSMKLQGIELLRSSISEPPKAGQPVTNYSFTINIEQRPDAERRLIFVIVDIGINTGDDGVNLGSLKASCIFFIENFKDIVSANEHGHLEVAVPLSHTLTSISLSTVRGLMFATFMGTYLHNAVLPILDPTRFNFSQMPEQDPTREGAE